MKISVTDTIQYQDIDAGETRQRVSWQISEMSEGDEPEEVVLFDGNQSFPLSASTEEITEFLAQCLQTHKDDMARHEEAEVLQEQLDNASAVAEEINGLEIND